jgi:hypothetical protein
LDQAVEIPTCFFKIFNTVFVLIPSDVFDYVAFKEIKGVAFDVINALNYSFVEGVVGGVDGIVSGVHN